MKKSFFTILTLLVTFSFILSACSTINPYTEEKQTSKLAIGAGIGAASGALVGLLTTKGKKNRENILIGAGIGAIAGGSIGYYMDVQEAKLREELRNSGVSVTRVGDQIILNMPENITFETGSFTINPGFDNVLLSVSKVLNKYKKTYIDIAGHTDSVGSHAYNQNLSMQRAGSVSTNLVNHGVMPERMLINGYGETQPIASNASAEGRAQNRRVSLTLTPITH